MIFLIDTIGVETGMHKYDESFHSKCQATDTSVGIISNYDSGQVFLKLGNYYHGGIARRLGILLIDLFKVLKFRLSHKSDCIIYQSFGLRPIDMLFCILFLKCKNFWILVHDLYQITSRNGDKSVRLNDFFYSRCFKRYICHSMDVKKQLESLCQQKGKRILYFPHIEYSYPTEYDFSKVQPEVVSAVDRKCRNVLFFGQVRYTKGIDILLEAWKLLKAPGFNLIIAGRDKDGLLTGLPKRDDVRIIARYISDDELNYLFTHTDLVVLPYREIYQSGVLETVVHFKKKAVLTPTDAFRQYVGMYPSFAVLSDDFSPDALARAIETSVEGMTGFSSEDVGKYAADHDIRRLLEQLSQS